LIIRTLEYTREKLLIFLMQWSNINNAFIIFFFKLNLINIYINKKNYDRNQYEYTHTLNSNPIYIDVKIH